MNYVHYSKQNTKAGELMKTEKPLIDYAPQRRCDDDVSLADKCAKVSKIVGIGAFCFFAWMVVLDLAFTAAGM